MNRLLILTALLLIATGSAHAEPYWIAWEADAFPETQGWERHFGDWEGPGHGMGAYRTLQDGVLTYDSLYDPGVYDYSSMALTKLDPEAGELFVIEWRLRARQVTGLWPYDPTVVVFSDKARALALDFREDELISVFEDVVIPIAPDEFHSYRLTSKDMLKYELWIDEALARVGWFSQGVSKSRVSWGDGVQGAASLHDWDYVRFGAVPEPSAAYLLWAVGFLCMRAVCTRRRADSC